MKRTSHSHFYLFLITLILDFGNGDAYSSDKQNYLLTLGRIDDIRVSRNTIGILTGDFDGDQITDIATYGGSQVKFGLYKNDSIHYPTSQLWSKNTIIRAAAAKINRDKITDLILITKNPLRIEIFLGKRTGTYYLAWEKEFYESFEEMLIADFNSDKKSDIILYGKNQIGVIVFLGSGNGSFLLPMIVFPEYSFSYMNVMDIHNDNLNDIIAVNWISNEVLIFTGFGKMTFSDPYILKFSSEPAFLTVANLDSETTKDLMIGLPDERMCQTYINDGFGSFLPHRVINLQGIPTVMEAADINGDKKNDLVILSSLNGTLTVMLNDGNGSFVEDIPFNAGQAPISMNLNLPSNNNNVHVAILDTVYNQLRIYHNAKCPYTTSKVQKFSGGIKPTSIVACDIDRDGWDDILIGDNSSKTLSIFKNYGNGNFVGQISLQLPFQVTKLKYFPKNETTAVILSTVEANKIAVIELNPFSFSYQSYHLLTQGETKILHVQENGNKEKQLEIFALERDKKTHQGTILKFEQICSNKFIQRYYQLHPSFYIITASIEDYERANRQQIVYVAFDRKNKKEHLFQTMLSLTHTLASQHSLYSFAASEPIGAHLQTVDINDDNLSDVILFLEGDEYSINVLTGQKDTIVTYSKNILKQTIPTLNIQNFMLKNINHDNLLDIVYEDVATRSINVCFGKGDATFTSPEKFVTVSGISDFNIDDLNNDGKGELILINSIEGFIEIINQ